MSGGSFNYVYSKVDDTDIFQVMGDVQDIEESLRFCGKHEAADEVLRFVKEVETHRRRLQIIGERIAPLLKATEWYVSGDSGQSEIDRAYFELMGIEPPGGDDE